MDEELEHLRRRKLLDLQSSLISEEPEIVGEEHVIEQQKKHILGRILTPDAKERLYRIKLVKPQVAELLENHIITAASTGRIKVIDDTTLKKLLEKIYSQTRDIKITRK